MVEERVSDCADGCPGKRRMCEGLPERESEDAEEGTLLHEAMASGNFEELTDEQAELCLWATEQVARVVDELHLADAEAHHEEELRYPVGHDCWLTGHPDLYLLERARLLIVDYKFGREMPPARTLSQLQLYCWMLMRLRGVNEAHLVALTPRTREVWQVEVEAGSLDWVEGYLGEAFAQEVILRPSEHACRYCEAVGHCPAAREVIETLPERSTYLGDLEPTELGALLDRATQAGRVVDEVKRWCKHHLQSGGAIDGWEVSSRKGNRKVEDATLLPEQLADRLDHPEILQAVEVKVTKLEEMWVERRPAGQTKVAAQREFAAALAENLRRESSYPVMRRRTHDG